MSPPTIRGIREPDLRDFANWLLARGYAESTAALYASRIGYCRANGIATAEQVNEKIGARCQQSRTNTRVAIGYYDEFRAEAAAQGISHAASMP